MCAVRVKGAATARALLGGAEEPLLDGHLARVQWTVSQDHTPKRCLFGWRGYWFTGGRFGFKDSLLI